jgi:sarcosine oxidase, subunit beta
MPHLGNVPNTAEVAIMGGGIIGLSIAYHLARLRVRAVVLERGRVGEGSTARSSGGIRRLFSTEPAIRLAMESVRFWEGAEEEIGTSVDWHRVGYMLIARSPLQRELLETSWHLQQRCGVPSHILRTDDVQRLVPAMRTDDVLAGLYCATDGYAAPDVAVRAFRDAAQRLGATIVEDCEVTGVCVRQGRVHGVETSNGTVDAPTVVNAAGVWAPLLARWVDVDIPITMFRRHQWVIQTPGRHVPVPCTVDMDSTLFVRPEGNEYLLGIGGERPTGSYETSVDPDAFGPVAELAIARFPSFRPPRLLRAWAGLTQETADRLPVLGPAGPAGYIVAAGFSQGFMHAPATGKAIAEYITTGKSASVPLEPFRCSRFAPIDPQPPPLDGY